MQLLWVRLDKLSYVEFFSKITKLKKQTAIFTPNPEMILWAVQDKNFRKTLEKADYLVPDGTWIYLAAQIMNEKDFLLSIIKLPLFIFNIMFRQYSMSRVYGDKICGSDLTQDLVCYAEEKWIHISIIDPYYPLDKEKVESQQNFAKNLQTEFPKLKFNFYVYKPEDKKEIIKKIHHSKSQILFSTLWMKKQEESIIEILWKCENIKLGLAVGSSFDYMIGFQKRAPEWMRWLGYEWLYRIFTGPQKIKRVKRLWNALIVFPFMIYKTR